MPIILLGTHAHLHIHACGSSTMHNIIQMQAAVNVQQKLKTAGKKKKFLFFHIFSCLDSVNLSAQCSLAAFSWLTGVKPYEVFCNFRSFA